MFVSFGLKKKLYKKGPLSLAAHQAAVEVSLMHALNKPLTKVCNVIEHDKSVFKMIWQCKIIPGSTNWGESLEYRNEKAKEALFYIFEQIGNAQPEAAEQPEENAEVEEVEDFEEPAQEAPKHAFFGYQDAQYKGFLTLPLTDPATKFAVSFSIYLHTPQLL